MTDEEKIYQMIPFLFIKMLLVAPCIRLKADTAHSVMGQMMFGARSIIANVQCLLSESFAMFFHNIIFGC